MKKSKHTMTEIRTNQSTKLKHVTQSITVIHNIIQLPKNALNEVLRNSRQRF